MINRFASLLLTLAIALTAALPVVAGDGDPLFINLTSDDAHRARMALSFGERQLDRGHPLTVFLNDRGVNLGAKSQAAAFAEHHKMLTGLMGKGAVVLACPLCIKHYGVAQSDLLEGITVGNPELTGAALFKENSQALTW